MVTYIEPPSLPRLGNSDPCRNISSPQAKIMKRYLLCLGYLQISKKTCKLGKPNFIRNSTRVLEE